MTSIAITDLLINEIQSLIGGSSVNLVAQISDGAAGLNRINTGIQLKVNEIFSNAHFRKLIPQRASSHHRKTKFFRFFFKSPKDKLALESVREAWRIFTFLQLDETLKQEQLKQCIKLKKFFNAVLN